MTNEQAYRLAGLMERQINGSISDAEFAELESALLDSVESRRLFLDLTHQHARLSLMGDSLIQEELDVAPGQRRRAFAWGSIAAAVCLAVGFLVWWQVSKPKIVATLVSSEYAAWESSSPTTPGTQLPRGFLKLEAGVATIQFLSGAEVMLQAPAHLILETPMRARLVSGSAVIHVPETAVGFVIDTPNAYAVDHGTEFAVSVDKTKRQSRFEVLSGEISVNHAHTDRAVRLTDNELAVATAESLRSIPRRQSEASFASEANLVRLGTSRDTSIVRHDERSIHLHPDFLMAKLSSSENNGFDRRSLFHFDVSRIDGGSIQSAQIRLNLVPTGLGYAAYLPETNTFAVYGVTDETAEDWSEQDLRWADAPNLDRCKLLGTFDVPRGRQTGSFTLGNAALVAFLKADNNRQVSFVLVRTTGERKYQGLVHAFASSRHPRASGPTLEVSVR